VDPVGPVWASQLEKFKRRSFKPGAANRKWAGWKGSAMPLWKMQLRLVRELCPMSFKLLQVLKPFKWDLRRLGSF
jgi:hypothetical protein